MSTDALSPSVSVWLREGPAPCVVSRSCKSCKHVYTLTSAMSKAWLALNLLKYTRFDWFWFPSARTASVAAAGTGQGHARTPSVRPPPRSWFRRLGARKQRRPTRCTRRDRSASQTEPKSLAKKLTDLRSPRIRTTVRVRA
jgi:hypothetical protein